MQKTSIEWVKNPDGTQGYTWNPITGCLNGCPYCYARKLANGRLRSRYLANRNIAIPKNAHFEMMKGVSGEPPAYEDPFYPRFWAERLIEPVNKLRRWGRNKSVFNAQSPKGIFVCDMSDLFGIGIPNEWTRRVLDKLQYAKQHRFYLLTKQPQNLVKFSPFPDNCWVGVTVTGENPKLSSLFNALDALDDIQCKVRYLSFEPLLGDFHEPLLGDFHIAADLDIILGGSVDWLIIGAQTKPYKPPKIEWVEEIVGAADLAGIPVFLKDNLLELLPIKPPFFIDPGPGKTAHYRQEMPE